MKNDARTSRTRKIGIRGRRRSLVWEERLAIKDQLHERVKELTLLHSAARLMQARGLTDQVVLTELAALLRPAFQYPGICQTRITFSELDAHTPGWCDSPWRIESSFSTSDGTRGTVEIVYVSKRPAAFEGPFLAEERKLIDSVAEMLAAYFERRQAEDRTTRLAYYEPTTGLPNRVQMQEHLTAAVKRAATAHKSLALMLLNLSHFREINNTLGHRNGDEFLRDISSRVRSILRKNDLLASLGGDEFAILLRHSDEVDHTIGMLEACLSQPSEIAGIPVKLDGAIGIAVYPEHGESAELLWQHCDVALRAAKDGHRGCQRYSSEIDHFHPQRIALLGELPGAIKHDELTLHYQPKVDLRTGRTVAVEALVRWQHPTHGLIYPDRFVILAERTQIINPLTRWVLTRAMRQCRTWHEAGYRIGLSVNLSVRNLLDAAFCKEILSIVAESGLSADWLTLEITESAVMVDPSRARIAMEKLAAGGIAFAMDDFGVGQSSLTYLKDLPMSKMKIDKSFVMALQEQRNAAIMHAAIELGHSLDLQVTAEGVESEYALEVLKKHGCELGQGYLFSKPIPANLLSAWLADSPWGCTSVHGAL